MVHRHRIPTIFNIYMLDVICCALGCVVLLWQVANQEAEEQTARAVEQTSKAQDARVDAETQSHLARLAREKFVKAHSDFMSASNDVTELRAALTDLQRKQESLSQALTLTEKERNQARILAANRQGAIDQTRKALALSEEQLKKLQEDLATLLASSKKSDAALTGQKKLNEELLARLMLSEKQLVSLTTLMSNKQIEIDTTTKKWQEQVVLLKVSQEKALQLQKLLNALRDDSKDLQTKLKLNELQLMLRDQELDKYRIEIKGFLASKEKSSKELALHAREVLEAKSIIASLKKERPLTQAEIATLMAERDLLREKLLSHTRELTSATQTIGELKSEKERLSQRVVDLRNEADQRFAGVPLTGENVIFLIDVSGSMVMKDTKTADPDKWPFLCETLMKLMRSIPTMKRFQVILFSDKTTYLFGNRDYWLKYEGPDTARTTSVALKKFEVGGNTNMQEGFEEAFRYHKVAPGLDTIYLFSDGLPNVGDGIPNTLRSPTEEQLNHHLGKFVRDKLKNEWNRPAPGKEPVRINAIGFYYDSPDVGAFLWAMTREHRGSFVGLR